MWKSEVFGARPFRVALAFVLAISAATIFAFGFIYFEVSRADIARVGGILSEETQRNVDANVSALDAALEARQTQNIRRIDYLALFDANGHKVLGNVLSLPPVAIDGLPHEVSASAIATAGAAPQASIFVARRRADGGVILLGRNLQDTFDIEDALLRALAVALAPTILLILAIGAWFARRALFRLDSIHDAIIRIMEGDLRSRLPVSRDSDEIDRIALAVNLMLDEIARLLDQLKSVGDNIAHDLRAPLAIVRHKIERALEAEPLPESAFNPLTAALAQLDRAAVTIAALLRISAVENASREKGFQDVDLAEICRQTLDFYEPLAELKSIDLTAEAAEPVWIRGDGGLMREAISNLVDNAIKFTPASGDVRIVAETREGRACVEICDTGPGVDPQDRERIFQRFYGASHGEGRSGHGLGLSIAKTIAELHGFTLYVEDGSPGARFVMRAADKASLARTRR